MNCTTNTVVSKKPHWFDNYQENLIENIKIEKKTEKKELKQERRTLRILNKLPEDIVKLCLEFVDEKIVLTLRYLVKLRERRQTRNDIIEKLLPACKIKCITLK